jgi:hypothetical protein
VRKGESEEFTADEEECITYALDILSAMVTVLGENEQVIELCNCFIGRVGFAHQDCASPELLSKVAHLATQLVAAFPGPMARYLAPGTDYGNLYLALIRRGR